MVPNFKSRLAKLDPLLGTLVTTSSQTCIEVLASSGYDWLFVDAEHGSIALSDIASIIRAAGGKANVLSRLPNHDAASFKQALDAGVDGVIVPLVNTAADAKRAVANTKYPPLGERSVGIGRAHGYGFDFSSYVASANDNTTLIIQIEHIHGVENLAEILDVKGIDGVFIGPYDLSGSLGILGEVKHQRVASAVEKVREGCRARNLPFGIFVMQPEAAIQEIQLGCRFIAVATDMFLLGSAARQGISSVRDGSSNKR